MLLWSDIVRDSMATLDPGDLSAAAAHGLDLYHDRRAWAIDADAQGPGDCGALSRWHVAAAAFDRD